MDIFNEKEEEGCDKMAPEITSNNGTVMAVKEGNPRYVDSIGIEVSELPQEFDGLGRHDKPRYSTLVPLLKLLLQNNHICGSVCTQLAKEKGRPYYEGFVKEIC